MTVCIIDVLEIVDVDDHQRALLTGQAQQAAYMLLYRCLVQQSCQLIRIPLPLQQAGLQDLPQLDPDEACVDSGADKQAAAHVHAVRKCQITRFELVSTHHKDRRQRHHKGGHPPGPVNDEQGRRHQKGAQGSGGQLGPDNRVQQDCIGTEKQIQQVPHGQYHARPQFSHCKGQDEQRGAGGGHDAVINLGIHDGIGKEAGNGQHREHHPAHHGSQRQCLPVLPAEHRLNALVFFLFNAAIQECIRSIFLQLHIGPFCPAIFPGGSRPGGIGNHPNQPVSSLWLQPFSGVSCFQPPHVISMHFPLFLLIIPWKTLSGYASVKILCTDTRCPGSLCSNLRKPGQQ